MLLCRGNLGSRQVFRRHWLLQAACLGVVAHSNARRCAWIAARFPEVAAAAGRFSAAARQASRLFTPQLLLVLGAKLRAAAGWRWLTAGPASACSMAASASGSCLAAPAVPMAVVAGKAAGWGRLWGSQPAAPRQQLAACLEVLLFAQLLLCYVAPCLALWRSELSSRRRFLDACADRSAR